MRTSSWISLALLGALSTASGCGSGEPSPQGGRALEQPEIGPPDGPALGEPSIEPAEGPQTGYFRVKLTLPSDLAAEAVEAVWVGDRLALLPQIEAPDVVSVLVQGALEPGPASVRVETADGPVALGPLLRYLPPLPGPFSRVVAFGASLTQGVQAGVPAFEGAFDGPAFLIARQLGADLPLPLLVPDLFTPVVPADIGPPPACRIPQISEVLAQQAVDLLPRLQPPGGGPVTGRLGRLDPDLLPHNLAVGGSQLRHHLRGPDTIGTRVVARLVYAPDGGLLGPVATAPLTLIEQLEPSLILSMDVFANDLAAPLILTDDLDPASAPSLAELEADLRVLLPALAATGAVSFLGNMPRPSLLPATADLKARRVAAAADPEAAAAEADQRIAAIDAHADAANALLAAVAAEHPRIHVVDLAAEVARIEIEGLRVGAHHLTVDKFGGLLGLDGIHFTDTGYAFLANVFLAALRDVLGVEVPLVDLAPVVEADPERPDRLAAAGLAACDP